MRGWSLLKTFARFVLSNGLFIVVLILLSLQIFYFGVLTVEQQELLDSIEFKKESCKPTFFLRFLRKLTQFGDIWWRNLFLLFGDEPLTYDALKILAIGSVLIGSLSIVLLHLMSNFIRTSVSSFEKKKNKIEIKN